MLRMRLAVVVVMLALFSARAARAGEGLHLDRAKTVRLDLSLAWQQPPAAPLVPPVGGAAIPSAPAPQVEHADGAQIAMAVVVTLIGDVTGILVASGTDSLWAGAIPWAIAPFGAALMCKAGGRSGRCRATLTGALIGAAVGLLPGMLILASAGSKPNDEEAYNQYLQTRFGGFVSTFFLYGIGVPVGTVIGYNLGGTPPSNPVTMPPVATVPIFSLRF